MKFSARTVYGLKAILVLASRYGEGSLSVSQIAKKEGISVAYLEQILNGLKKKGLVKSVRGPQGGYVLFKKPSDITLETLLYSLEERVFLPARMRSHGDGDEVSIGHFLFWEKLRASLEKGLSEVTLKQVLDEARRLKKSKTPVSSHPFSI